MKRSLAVGIVIILVVSSALPLVVSSHSPAPVASPEGCPITKSNTSQELPMRLGGPGGYMNDALWTTLRMWGEQDGIVHAPRDQRIDDEGGINGMKWAWYRFKTGTLTITGQRLDAPADPLTADVPEGYGDTGFQVAGINFPSIGCWEITGHLGEDSLTFVVLVDIVEPWFDVATPAA